MRPRKDDITLTGRGKNGNFIVAHIRRESGSFSVTGEKFASQKAWELGNENACLSCGQITEQIEAAFPHIKPIMRLHLSDIETGEPMHGPGNGWYYWSGDAMRREIDARSKGRKNDYSAPDDIYSPEFTDHYRQRAARILRCEAEEIPTPFGQAGESYKEEYDRWIDDVMRDRWHREADMVNLWIDSNLTDVEIPSQQTDEEEFEITLDAGLHVKSTLRDEPLYVDTLGGNYVYEYDVTVNVEGIDLTYTARYGSSINDYMEGIVNAREAAFGVLRELCDFIYETAEGFIENVCGESWDDIEPEMKKRMKLAEAAAEAFEGALLANGDVVMS